MENYATVREELGCLLGKTILDVTQHDESYFQEHGIGFIDLMLDSGDVMRVWSMHGDEPLIAINPEGDTPDTVVGGE